MKNPIKHTIVEFERVLDEASKQLLKYTEEEAGKKPAPNKWSKKEILGHLIDSAANNHQRFVRMQIDNNLQLPSYQQVEWVSIQHYNTESWNELIRLWEAYNLHLLHILWNMNPGKLLNTAIIGTNDEATLEFIIEDYVGHLKHHLEQIIGE
jgi:DinB superfamily